MIKRSEWSKPHRHGGVFPELRHQTWMRITGEAFSIATNLASEMIHVFFVESTLKKCTCIDAWCSVTLEIHMVARCSVGLAAEEMVEAHFIQCGGTRKGGKVSADSFVGMICARNHDGCVPTDVCANATLDVFVAGEPWFVIERNGVHIRGGHRCGETDVALLRSLKKSSQQIARAVRSVSDNNGVE